MIPDIQRGLRDARADRKTGRSSSSHEDHPGPRSRVVLVREWEQQLSSSGCCGRIEGEFLDFGEEGESAFPDRRDDMECAGALYRAVKARYGDRVHVRIVDPRNLLSLVPIVLTDARDHGASVVETVRSLLRLSVNTVLVNGRVMARNRWPDPQEVFAVLDDAIEDGLRAEAAV